MATQPINIDKDKLIERAQKSLVRRNNALADTLNEIKAFELMLEQATTPVAQAQLQGAIAQAKVKRDRQHRSCQATEGVITALTALDQPPKKRP